MKALLTYSHIAYSVLVTMLVMAAQAPVHAATAGCDTLACISQRNTSKSPRKFKPRKFAPKPHAPVQAPAQAQVQVKNVRPPKLAPVDEAAMRSAIKISQANSAERMSLPEVVSVRENNESGIACSGASGCGASSGVSYDPVATLQQASEVIREYAEAPVKRAEMCSNFADENGLNEWGKKLVKISRDPLFKEFYEGTPDIHKYCPNFSNMAPVEKDGLHLIMYVGMSNSESSCDPTKSLAQKKKGSKRLGAPNGTAAGHIALHLGKEDTYVKISPRNRNPDVDPEKYEDLEDACVRNASLSVEKSMRCYFAMGTLRAINKNPKDRAWITKHHFDVLNPRAKIRRGKSLSEAKILINSIKQYKYCKVPDNAGIKTAKN